MRTTIDIDDEVFREFKKLAAEEKTTLRHVIVNALRAELARRRGHASDSDQERVITFKGRGTLPGVNLDSSADLLDLMEGRR
jgi:hypothetical protein